MTVGGAQRAEPFRSTQQTPALRILDELAHVSLRENAKVAPIVRGKIVAFQIQVLAELLPDGDLKDQLQRLGRQALADGELGVIAPDVDARLEAAVRRANLGGTIDQEAMTIGQTFPKGRVGDIERRNLAHAAALLKKSAGLPVIRIRDYVDAQKTLVLGFDRPIGHALENQIDGIPWQLFSNPVLDSDGIFAWGPPFISRVQYIFAVDGRITFMGHTPQVPDRNLDSTLAGLGFYVGRQIQEQIPDGHALPQNWTAVMDREQPPIPPEKRLDLFRYHCFLAAFRAANDNDPGVGANKVQDHSDDCACYEGLPDPAIAHYESFAPSAIRCVGNLTQRIETGQGRGGIPGETTYFEFAYLLSLPPDCPKFQLTTDDRLRLTLADPNGMGDDFVMALCQRVEPLSLQNGQWAVTSFLG
ncbi:MAG: hypothetical protein LBH53_03670 [Puniceicoccales bacterium]|jgi:hypothetical protein|nr:hypothetical protein [Puniceicoccales bacterium]